MKTEQITLCETCGFIGRPDRLKAGRCPAGCDAPVQFFDVRPKPIPRADVDAALGQIRALAGSALTGSVHHAYATCALIVERVLGEEPGTPEFQRIGAGS